jgi:hypothetical protein
VSARDRIDRVRHHLRRPVARTPYVWDAAMALRTGKRATLARRDTALVIEGFLRSGNTFSVAAFIVANGDDLHLGRHLHGGPHVLRAARLGVPAVVLIRRPADAVASYLVRRPTLTPNDALLEYVDFYRTCWRVRDDFVVGLFDDVVADFGSVLRAVNERFGTSFRPYDPTPANQAAAFALVEEMNRRECRGEVVESHVGRPSDERREHTRAIADRLREPGSAKALARADVWYQRYLALADASRPLAGPTSAGPEAP